MSIRAYKLIEIKTEKEPTFNLSANYGWLSQYGNLEDSIITFEIDEIVKALDTETDPERLKILEAIEKDAEGETDLMVEYYTY